MDKPMGKYAGTAKVGEKGQIVIPKEAREVFGIRPGDTLLVLGDIERGLALVKNDAFIQFAQAIFDAQDPKEESKCMPSKSWD